MIWYFTYESRDALKSFTLFITVKTITKLNLGHSDKFHVKTKKISRRGSRSLLIDFAPAATHESYAEFGHFTLLFCRGRQRNVQWFKTHVHSHFSVHKTFCLATVPLPSYVAFLGPVHTNPDIFESATFSFRIQKFPCPHVTYSNRIWLSTRSKNIRIRCRIRRMREDGSRIWKEKLRIQKYSDTCGRGLELPTFFLVCGHFPPSAVIVSENCSFTTSSLTNSSHLM